MSFHLRVILVMVRLPWESPLGAVQMSGVLSVSGEAPAVISGQVEQWAAHPALPSPNRESKGAASSTGVLTCDEIRKHEIRLFQMGREEHEHFQKKWVIRKAGGRADREPFLGRLT